MDRIEITDEALKMFENRLIERECTYNTIYTYLFSVKKYIGTKGRILTRNGLIEYKNELLNLGYSPSTINCRLTALISFTKTFYGDFEVKKVKVQKRTSVENVPTVEEYNAILERTKDAGQWKKYWAIKFLAKTGARGSELLKLRKECLAAGYQDVWNKGKIRRVYVPESLTKESEDYFAEKTGWLFPNRNNGMMSVRGLEKLVKTAGELSGVRSEVCHPHAFRHFFAIQFLENGGELSMLSNILGHTSMTTTSIYTQKTMSEQMKKMDEISIRW